VEWVFDFVELAFLFRFQTLPGGGVVRHKQRGERFKIIITAYLFIFLNIE